MWGSYSTRLQALSLSELSCSHWPWAELCVAETGPPFPVNSHLPRSLRAELPSKPSSQTLTQAHDPTVSFPTLGSPSEHEHPSWLQDSRCLGRHDPTAWECPMDTPVTPTAVSSRVPCYCLQRIHAL